MTAPDSEGVTGQAFANDCIGDVAPRLLRADRESRRRWRRSGWARAEAIHERLKATNVAAMRNAAMAGQAVGLDLGGLRFEIASPIEQVGLALAEYFRCGVNRDAGPADVAIAVVPFNAPEANIAIVSPARLTLAWLPERGDVPYVTREWHTKSVTGGFLGPFDEADGIPGMVIAEPWEWAEGLVALLEMEMIRIGAQRRPDAVYLRAASLQQEGRAILLLGQPGSGKSALAPALAAEGFELLDHDTVCIDIVSRRLHAYPRKVPVRRTSSGLPMPTPDPQVTELRSTGYADGTGLGRPDSMVAALVFLDGFAEEPALTEMSAVEVRAGLTRQTLTPPPVSAAIHFMQLCRFIAGVDCYRLQAGSPMATATLIRRHLAPGRTVMRSELG